MSIIQIKTPRWSLPLLEPARIKGAKGGRASGKSHFMGEMLIEEHVMNPDQQTVCVREIQKSLKFSAKKLLEEKIERLGVGHLFEVTLTEIRRKGANGIIIFQGLQDHTADSIKSLEGFDRAWCEEAQSLSKRSLELLEPTIRKPNSELWFTWNPDQPTDAVEQLFEQSPDAVLVHVNYTDNPWCPDEMKRLAEKTRQADYQKFRHIWLGQFNEKSEKLVFNNKYTVSEFEPKEHWDGAYYGLDFGFSQDPTAAVECYIADSKLWIRRDCGKVGLELDDTAEYVKKHLPNIGSHTIRADSARPESISYLRRSGLQGIKPVAKGKGSVEDGVEFIKSFDTVVIHPDAVNIANEFGLYSYKVDARSGDIMPVIEDKHNHWVDALRYALEPIMKRSKLASGIKVGT